MEKKFKIKINSVEKIEAILQEIYDDSVRQINLIQNKINELEFNTINKIKCRKRSELFNKNIMYKKYLDLYNHK